MKKKFLLALMALTACHEQAVIAPQPKWYYYNEREEVVGNLTRHDAFATYVVKTAAPELTIRAATNLQPPFLSLLAQVTALVDGQPWRTFHLNAAEQEFKLRLDSVPGPHVVRLVEGSQIRAYEKGSVGFTSITGLSVGQGYRLDSIAEGFSAGLVVWGDSRTVGGGDEIPGQQAWPVLLRPRLPSTEIFTPGYGSLTLGVHIDTAAGRAALVEEIVRCLRPYAQQTVWLEAGVNDYLTAGYTPSQLSTYYHTLLPALHAALPRAQIILQTDVAAGTETANKAGYTLPQYRQGEAAGGAGFGYVQIVDGLQLGTTADLSPDNIHLSAAGEMRFAERAAKLL